LLGIERRQIEEFSFALAVVLTPIVVGLEFWRLVKAHPEMIHGGGLMQLLEPGLLGMACSFVAGYLALKLLSSLLEAGRWKYFGYYCLIAAAVVFGLAYQESAEASSMSMTLPAEIAPTNATPEPASTNASTLPPVPIPAMNPASASTMQPASASSTVLTPIPATNSDSSTPTTNAAPEMVPPATNETPAAPAP
jgi:hypothetical protein